MDDERFDAAIRALGNGATRRGALGLLAGLAGLGLGEAAAKGRRKHKAKKQGTGAQRDQTGEANGAGEENGGAQRVQAGEAKQAGKVTLCHHDQDADTWHPITVSANAVDKHKANHGDFEYDAAAGECCTNTDCDGESEACVIAVDADGTGSGSCEVDCSSAANGTACGTQEGAGTLRCCNGTCPSSTPPCRPVGTPCLVGEDPFTCQQQCCSRNLNSFTNRCQGNTPDPNGNRCASDTDCRPEFNATCQCGGCCNGPGVVPYTSTTCGGCRDCRSCCSGACQENAVICT